MSRKRLATVLLTTSFAVGAAFGVAAPASAHGAVATGGARASAVSGEARVLSEWFYAGIYDTRDQCRAEGEYLIRINVARNYTCTYKRGRYELYVQYNE
jgi:hypothetical protein